MQRIMRVKQNVRQAGVLLTIALSAGAGAQVQELSLFDAPPAIVRAVEPNLVVTLDNSPSMYFGFAPDSLARDHRLRGAKSSHYNKLYYDPQKTYLPPVYADGRSFPPANFLYALPNPFNDADLAVDLAGDDGSLTIPIRGNATVLERHYSVRWNESRLWWLAEWSASDALADQPATARRAYYYNFREDLPGCESLATDPVVRARELERNDACYELVIVGNASGPERVRPELGLNNGQPVVSSDERQNFANWYQYYSLRILAAKTIMTHLFARDALDGAVRVAYQSVAQPGPVSGTAESPVSSVTPLAEARDALFARMLNERYGESKRLKSAMLAAGEFFRSDNANDIGPYRERPWDQQNPGVSLSCRSNYHLLVSDGGWSGDESVNLDRVGNADNVSTPLPDGTSYSAAMPLYRGTQAGTLADIAFYYWSRDLSPLRNNVPAIYRRGDNDRDESYWDYLNDPATWQHLTQFAVSLGAEGNVPADGSALDALSASQTFVDNTGQALAGWPDVDALLFGDPRKVDDLYHAAINSRGAFYDALDFAMREQVVSTISASVSSEQLSYLPVAVNTGAVSSEALIFRAEYDGSTRSGDLAAFPIATGAADSPCAGDAGTICPTPRWRLNNGGYRGASRVYTFNPDGGLQRGIDFAPAQVTAAIRDLLRFPAETDDAVNARIDYLRGSDQNEQAQGGALRTRSDEQRTLGPVINSAPVYVGNGFNANGSREMGYPDDLEAESYGEFLASVNQRTPMVYVGSNDGKLHAVDATSGAPVFDYIPHALLSQLKFSSQPNFSGAPGVDGAIATADVFFNDAWRTVLVGGLRTGGKAYYALDITDPTAGDASDKVLWELTPSSPGAAQLGFSFSKPLIVKSNARAGAGDATRWVAIFGNGYNSVDGEAVLFIVDIGSGEVLRAITTRSAVNPPDPFVPNGLNTPAAVFADSNFTADYVYAGDLRGNLWKFDLSASNPADWKVAYGTALNNPDSSSYDPEPLFVATDADGNTQPITAAPIVGGHPQGRDGLMVYVGTGKFLERSDSLSTDPQSFYAIWDRDLCNGGASCISVAGGAGKSHERVRFDRDDLLRQRVESESAEARFVSDENIDWQTHSGWYLDFPARGELAAERVIAQASLRSGIVVFPTFIPGADACEGLGSGWLMALSRINGGALDHEPFTSNRGDIEDNDYSEVPSAGRSVDTQLLETTVLGCGDKSCIVSDETGAMEVLDEGMQWGRWRWKVLQ